MSPGYLMALDAGGGGGYCLLVEIESGKLTRASRPWVHPVAAGTGGLGSDLDLNIIWVRLSEAAREVMARAGAAAEQVVAVVATSMRHSTVVLDAAGDALLAASNHDSRALSQAFDLAAQGDEFYALTGHWPNPVCTGPRLQWLAASDPAAWRRASVVLSLSDWITYRLCGEIATDTSQAGESLLLDVARRQWAWDVIERLGLPRNIFPPLREPGTRIGKLSAAAAESLGLGAGTLVAMGGADTQCGVLGAGAVSAGQVAVVAGTSVPVQLVVDRVCIDPKQRLWTGCHVVPGLWVLESNAGLMGEVLDWLADVLYPEAPGATGRLLAEASFSEPGAAGIISTFGANVMNARQLQLPAGSFTLSHLSTSHDSRRRRHLVRSVVDGMAYALRANIEQVREVAGQEIESVRFGGGISRSRAFAQVLSDVVGVPVETSAEEEATPLGAAICGGVAAGVFRDFREGAEKLGRSIRRVEPDADRVRTYADLYNGWEELRAVRGEADTVAVQLMMPSVLRHMNEVSSAAAMTRPRTFVTADMDEEVLATLRQLGDVEYASFRREMRLLTGRSLVEALSGFQVFMTEVDIVDARVLDQLPELRVIASCRGDAVNIDVSACTAFGVPVLHAPGRNADAVADLALTFMLMLARRLPEAASFLRQPGSVAGDIGRMGQAFEKLQGRELWRKVVGLVGLGAVGRAVTRRLAAFGAQLLVCDPYVPVEQILLAGAEPVSLDELLERSDFVSLHAMVTDESKGLIGAAQLARMKPGAFLINTARAALVDENALIEALRGGKLGGAALDVFSVEPPGSDHPLLALDNVIATPHVGGNTADVAVHQGYIVAEDLRRLLGGERPLHALNPEVLEHFDWKHPRPQPDAKTRARLAARPAPAVSDLQRDRGAAAGKPAATARVAASAQAPPEIRERMERILEGFVSRAVRSQALRSVAADKDVTLHFMLPDLGLSFYLRLGDGKLGGAVKDPDAPADVELRMRAEVFDGMFTGSVNPMQAALSGRLSFSGDTLKAMTLQEMQEDLSRLYREAREEAGGPGDLASVPDPEAAVAGGAAVRPLEPGDIRHELVQVVNELYAAELITATGGNVSARDPAAPEEVWITPGQLFKGELRPEIMVRIGLDGRALDPGSHSASSERLMHCGVYRVRPDAQAVVHAHAPHATVLANAGLPFLPISTEAAFFGNIPRVPFIMPGTEELANAVAEAMRDSWAVLLQNHGLLVAGRSLRRAADMVEIIERSTEIILGCYAVGKRPPTIPEEIIRTLRRMGDIVA